jgi:hypothetical protein
MPRLEKLIGLERAGAWSIWFEAVCLTPALVAFFYGLGPYGHHGQTWNSVLLFGGIALSRIGLWSFDLCQVGLGRTRTGPLNADDISSRNYRSLCRIIRIGTD